MILVELVRAVGKLVGGNNELFALELVLELCVFVITDLGTKTLTHELERSIIVWVEGIVDFEFF